MLILTLPLSHLPLTLLYIYADEESEPLNTSTTGPSDSSSSSSSNNNNNTSSWKKYTIAATTLLALVALFNHHSSTISSSNNIAPDSVDLLSKHDDATDLMHHGHSKKAAGKGEKKHELTKAEMNTKLFDAKRKLLLYMIFDMLGCCDLLCRHILAYII